MLEKASQDIFNVPRRPLNHEKNAQNAADKGRAVSEWPHGDGLAGDWSVVQAEPTDRRRRVSGEYKSEQARSLPLFRLCLFQVSRLLAFLARP